MNFLVYPAPSVVLILLPSQVLPFVQHAPPSWTAGEELAGELGNHDPISLTEHQPHLPEPGVKQFFEKHAQVKDMYLFRRSPFGGHSGQSLVHFASASELAKALQLNGRLLHNYKLHIEPTVQEAHEVDFPADGQRPIRYKFRSPLLYVTGQPLEATEEELVVAFRRFGAVRWVQNFHRDRKKFVRGRW